MHSQIFVERVIKYGIKLSFIAFMGLQKYVFFYFTRMDRLDFKRALLKSSEADIRMQATCVRSEA